MTPQEDATQPERKEIGRPLDRRQFLSTAGGGLGGVAFAALLSGAETSRPVDEPRPLAARPSHYGARARQLIQIFCPGGMSQVDTFDWKPELARRAGQPFDPSGKLQFFASKPGRCQPSYWPFRQHGECGRWVSDLFPRLATHVDEMAFIYSMQSKTALHGPACFLMNSGFSVPGFPSMGSWVTYGLGSETENLPAFVVLPDPRGLPPGGAMNWGAGFLPAVHQGTTLRASRGRNAITDLFPPESAAAVTPDVERSSRRFLEVLNRRHAEERPGDSELDARIAAYELAARLQLSAPEATDLSGETRATRKLYELDHPDWGPFGRQCLLARRLIERGVRFVQIYCGAENTTAKKIRPNWDSHEDLPRDHGYWGAVLDRGAAALLEDLRGRGLLDETLVTCTTEFGRQPGSQGGKGRDHNAGAFTAWLAGAGVRGGAAYGATDALGFRAEIHPTYGYDLNATSLHLLGLDHEKLTYYHNGIERRLTDVHGHVIHDVIEA